MTTVFLRKGKTLFPYIQASQKTFSRKFTFPCYNKKRESSETFLHFSLFHVIQHLKRKKSQKT